MRVHFHARHFHARFFERGDQFSATCCCDPPIDVPRAALPHPLYRGILLRSSKPPAPQDPDAVIRRVAKQGAFSEFAAAAAAMTQLARARSPSEAYVCLRDVLAFSTVVFVSTAICQDVLVLFCFVCFFFFAESHPHSRVEKPLSCPVSVQLHGNLCKFDNKLNALS